MNQNIISDPNGQGYATYPTPELCDCWKSASIYDWGNCERCKAGKAEDHEYCDSDHHNHSNTPDQ